MSNGGLCPQEPVFSMCIATSHLLNVVHADQNPISPIIKDDQLFGQLLLIVHGCRNAEPLPPFKPWPPDVTKPSSQTKVSV